MRVELETTKEVRVMVKIREEAAKIRVAKRYHTKVQPRAFKPCNLIWQARVEGIKDP